ncbi:MAG: DUF1508 domain-containing protein [Flavobacterium sp. BFFFF1]|uniref:YegP family protein n=1 Tax=Flavobacterium sp. BFFFF1 TaxID=2015557 RepID=UPI000BD12030|nr:DUF1508 domain-containing protein [Flavobacterium sp. BFFFF1]OYU79504.1 MAG: DUF1508 domain-containing protein [Flavobacterium sp. BFFFF1]
MGAFVISKRFNGEYKFAFTSRKGKTIFSSQGYELKFECEEAIELLKSNLADAVYSRHKASGGRYYFRMKVGEALLVTSRKYSTELKLQKGIDEINQSAVAAEVLDFSQNDVIFN